MIMNSLIEYANSTGDRWAAWLLMSSLDSAVLLGLVSVVWLIIRKRVAPQVGYCLFLLVPLKLLIPVSVTMPAAIAQWTPSVCAASLFNARHQADPTGRHSAITQKVTSDVELSKNLEANIEATAEASVESTSVDQFVSEMEVGVPSQIISAQMPAALTVTDKAQLSVTAIAALVWLCCVLFLLARLVHSQLRFRARLQHCDRVDRSRWSVNVSELCTRAGIAPTVRVIEDDCVAAPAVWGFLQPTIILPRGLAASLTSQQLRWALFHELAHIGRRDLFVVLLQRIAAIVHFLNPFVWIANRIIHRLREYACDDLAVELSESAPVEPGEAFLEILRHANNSPEVLEGALGIFGLDSRAACFQRVRRLLDFERPIRIKSGRLALCSLLLLALVALPHIRAANDDPQTNPMPEIKGAAVEDKSAPQTEVKELLARDTGTFDLKVVGPDRKPVPDVMIRLDAHQDVVAENILHGSFVRKASYGVYVKTDALGRLVVKLLPTANSLTANVTTPGYGPYFASWSGDNPSQLIPATFTAELESGWSVGGVMVDDTGKPIADAEIQPSIKFKKRPGDVEELGVGASVKTDSNGKWHFDSVPASKLEVFVEINHPGYMPLRRSLTRSEFGIDAGQEPVTRIVLNRGLTVTGKVTDESGAPIVGALIRTKFLNDIREAKTGDDGTYRLSGCEPRMASIVVSAKGRALDKQVVRIDLEMEPVNFKMQPGGTVRIQVLDLQGKVVPKARIFFQRWRNDYSYFEFDRVGQYADEKGNWEWKEAPLDEFRADICSPDGMNLNQEPLIARAEPYIFRVPPALVISGKVIDADTKQPIKTIQVVPGCRSEDGRIQWFRADQFTVTHGIYRYRETHSYPAHVVRIEASGYQAGITRELKSNEGNVTIDFELKKGTDFVATILTPDGKPAAKAQAALGVAGSQISINNGELDRGSTYHALQQDSNEAGQVRFPTQETAFQLVVLHPTGYAHITTTPDSAPDTIELKAWARVEGTFRIGKAPGPNLPLSISPSALQSYGENVPHISATYYTTTGKDGQFVFERVVPGHARISRRITRTVKDGAAETASSASVAIELPAGETIKTDLGGTGQPVIGKLVPPKEFKGKVNWSFAEVNVGTYLPPLPEVAQPVVPKEIEQDPAKRQEWLRNWELTPPGKIWLSWKRTLKDRDNTRRSKPSFHASVDRDGSFRIDDMPAGNYEVRIWFHENAPGILRDFPFTVPPIEGPRSDIPLDLGVLTLTGR
jgi:beta-lactamase regulating signal transducer with metallopeptidase domain